MSPRIFVAMICLMLSWASNVNPVAAQPAEKPAKTDKRVRVTYPIADLIVPIEDHTAFSERKPEKEGREVTKDTLAAALVKRITDSVAKETWDSAGGKATIQYFPIGLALVVHQREDVQQEIARLLADLRRLADVQVSMEVRLIQQASPATVKQIRARMDAEGQAVRAINIEKPANVGRFVSVDDKQVHVILEMAQTDRAVHILQAPKLTVFNGQQAGVNGMIDGAGVRLDVWPVVAVDQKSVRFSLHLEHAANSRKKAEAIGTFAVPANRTLIWHIADDLFVLVTPRVIVVEEDKSLFLGNVPPIPGPDGAEEQSIPVPKKPGNQPSAKEKAIQDRLKEPISVNFKEVPLREAIKVIAIQSGIQVVPDTRALQEAKINMDAPVSGSVDNIKLKNALAILLKPMRLRWVIEGEVLKITTEDRCGRLIKATYKVGDIVSPPPTVVGQEPPKMEAELMELIQSTVAKNTWEANGGVGTLQYFPAEKKLTVTHCQEVQEEIQLLLATLRTLQDLTVNVEVRLVNASSDTAESLRKELAQDGDRLEAFRLSMRDSNAALSWVNRFGPARESIPLRASIGSPLYFSADEAGVQHFLEIARTSGTVLSAPKINVYNGQRLAMNCLQKQIAVTEFRVPVNEPAIASVRHSEIRNETSTISSATKEKATSGWRYDVQPIVSPDRRSVRLNLCFEHFVNADAIEHTTKAAATFTVPDQRTVVWHLGAAANGQHLFVLVTARVIVREEEKEENPPTCVLPIPGR